MFEQVIKSPIKENIKMFESNRDQAARYDTYPIYRIVQYLSTQKIIQLIKKADLLSQYSVQCF